MGDDIEQRTRQLEIDMGVVRHDVNNMRLAVTGLDTKIDKLRASIVQMGVSIISAMFLMLLSIIGYFVMQKDTQLDEIRKIAIQIEARNQRDNNHNQPTETAPIHD